MIDKLSDKAIRHTFLAVWIITPLAYVIGRVVWDVVVGLMVIRAVLGR